MIIVKRLYMFRVDLMHLANLLATVLCICLNSFCNVLTVASPYKRDQLQARNYRASTISILLSEFTEHPQRLIRFMYAISSKMQLTVCLCTFIYDKIKVFPNNQKLCFCPLPPFLTYMHIYVNIWTAYILVLVLHISILIHTQKTSTNRYRTSGTYIKTFKLLSLVVLFAGNV